MHLLSCLSKLGHNVCIIYLIILFRFNDPYPKCLVVLIDYEMHRKFKLFKQITNWEFEVECGLSIINNHKL